MYVVDCSSLLYVPPSFGVVSALYITGKALTLRRPTARETYSQIPTANSQEESVRGASRYKQRRTWAEMMQDYDGAVIILFRTLRVLSITSLLDIEVSEVVTKEVTKVCYFELALYTYAFVLGLLALFGTARWRDMASLQLSVILLSEFIVYFILDVWPFFTLDLTPYDPSGPATWMRIAFLTLSAVVVPLIKPRPVRPSTTQEETVSILSSISFNYLTHLVFLAWRIPHVGLEDLPEVPERRKVESLSNRAMMLFDPSLLKGKRHILWGFLSMWGFDYFNVFIWDTLYSLAKFIGVLGTKYLLSYLESGISPYGLQPWVWIFLVGFGPSIAFYLLDQYTYYGTRINVENSSFLSFLVYNHALRIRLIGNSPGKRKSGTTSPQGTSTPVEHETEPPESGESSHCDTTCTEAAPAGSHDNQRPEHTMGRITNLITTDLTIIENSYTVLQLPSILLQIIFSAVFLYQLLGWSSLVGLSLMIVLTPVPTRIGQLIVGVHKDKMAMTDRRVQAVSENLGVIRMIKLFSWEAHIHKDFSERRTEELQKMRKERILDVVLNIFNTALLLIAKVTTIAIYVLVIKGNLTPSRIFSSFMFFNILKEQLCMFMNQLPKVLQAKVSYDRYTEFLNDMELLEETKNDDMVALDADAIGFSNCSFSWTKVDQIGDDGSNSRQHTQKEFRLSFDGEVRFKRGEINIVVGPSASGKTSLLMALLGEMYYKPHGVNSWYNLPRETGIAYAPQESWVFNDTIKQNILFGEAYDEKRYKMVLEQCALEHILSQWDAGDLTEVGEKGVTLSGGQKARVALARALYSSAGIILLDGILAAVDVHTAKWIVEKALQGDLVKGRTILLVTHNVSLLSPIAGYVVLLGRHGRVAAMGSVEDVLKEHPQLRMRVKKFCDDTKVELATVENNKPVIHTAGKLIVAEEKPIGRVQLAALMLYINGVGKIWMWALLVSALAAAVAFSVFQTWFVGYWSAQYEIHLPSEVPVLRFLLIYIFLSIFSEVVDLVSQILWTFRTLRATKVIYFQLLESVVSATFRWLDITPKGRIIARCTQDIDSVNDQFTPMAYGFLRFTAILIISLASSVFMTGWAAFVPGISLLSFGSFLGFVYLKCQICIRREMNNAKAPVMSQLGTVLSGLSSIRAYGAQELFSSELKRRIDACAKASLTYHDINRWVSMRINTMSGIFATAVAAYLVYGGGVSAGAAGFTITVVSSVSKNIVYWVRLYNMLEIQANSLERILGFLRIDHEPKPSNEGKPPAYWPSSGSLLVEGLSARYSDDSPEVLSDISFEVNPGERIGIVGRTGAGKSSIALALLRAIKTTGKVYYDGIPTDEINLDALRSNITLIPQQPQLLNGTLRINLDPFGQHDDATLYDALRVAGLFDAQDTVASPFLSTESQDGDNVTFTLEEGEKQANLKIGLDTMVESKGANFSLGQRQIIALARALVRRSKLLILDEATAAIDYETDAAIQRTLRTEFGTDTTLITIAHRLQTIMDYDKIMVLDSGRLVEYDSPKVLLEDKIGYFRSLVDSSGDRDILLKLASA